jgi:hypothetical protein
MPPPMSIGDLSVRVRIGYAHENWLYYTTAGVVVLGYKTWMRESAAFDALRTNAALLLL